MTQNSKFADDQIENTKGKSNPILSVQKLCHLHWWPLVLCLSLLLSTVVQFGLARYPDTTADVFEKIAGPGMAIVNDKLACEASRKRFKDILKLQGNESELQKFEKLWILDPC